MVNSEFFIKAHSEHTMSFSVHALKTGLGCINCLPSVPRYAWKRLKQRLRSAHKLHITTKKEKEIKREKEKEKLIHKQSRLNKGHRWHSDGCWGRKNISIARSGMYVHPVHPVVGWSPTLLNTLWEDGIVCTPNHVQFKDDKNFPGLPCFFSFNRRVVTFPRKC